MKKVFQSTVMIYENIVVGNMVVVNVGIGVERHKVQGTSNIKIGDLVLLNFLKVIVFIRS